MRRTPFVIALLACSALAATVGAQEKAAPSSPAKDTPAPAAPAKRSTAATSVPVAPARAQAAPLLGPPAPPGPEAIEAAVRDGIALLLSAQEGEPRAQWPYEGVYRVGGEIPFGYRIGGTAIVGEALLTSPGYGSDAARQAAVQRAAEFICTGINEPLMSPIYDAGYDVRGWGYCFGARFLLLLRAAKQVPAGLEAQAETALRWYLDAMQRTEIPQVGGWNYARKPGIETPCAASPFMTAPCLEVLFEAHRQGLPVDQAVVARAIAALERCRTDEGNVSYSAQGQTKEPARSIPGAIGRMVATESVLMRAGRSDAAKVQRALDAFLASWRELEKRRQKNGTHVAPYGVAPYYFFYGFFHACDAVELLPAERRPEYRRQLEQLLFAVRNDDGTWNDRVFPRSRGFGTAMTIMALQRPQLPAPATWKGQLPPEGKEQAK